MIFTVIMNPGTLGYILVIEVLKTKDLTFKNSRNSKNKISKVKKNKINKRKNKINSCAVG